MRDRAPPLPQPLDNGFICRQQVINAQRISTHTIDGLQVIGHRTRNEVALLLAEGVSVADIARRLGRRYHMVWIEARKLMADAKKVRVRAVERPAPTVELEVLEVFAELQGIVPEHLRR